MISDDLIPVRNNGKSSRESGGRNGTKNGKKKQREDTKRRSRRNAVIPEDVLATIDMSGTLRCEFETVQSHDGCVSVRVKHSSLWDHDGIRSVLQRLMCDLINDLNDRPIMQADLEAATSIFFRFCTVFVWRRSLRQLSILHISALYLKLSSVKEVEL